MRLFLVTLLMLISHQSALGADDPDWFIGVLKKEKPNELAYKVRVDPNCPITKEKVVSIVEDVFVRSRIKPLGGNLYMYMFAPVYLKVTVNCLKLEASNPVYINAIYFGNYSEYVPTLYDHLLGNYGIGPVDAIETNIKANVEDAITAYLKANFDLGE